MRNHEASSEKDVGESGQSGVIEMLPLLARYKNLFSEDAAFLFLKAPPLNVVATHAMKHNRIL